LLSFFGRRTKVDKGMALLILVQCGSSEIAAIQVRVILMVAITYRIIRILALHITTIQVVIIVAMIQVVTIPEIVIVVDLMAGEVAISCTNSRMNISGAGNPNRTEPNQALQRINMLVTDHAPSSMLRAKHVYR
jgi:hypothetical protein